VYLDCDRGDRPDPVEKNETKELKKQAR
jgi:hypothetical protein